MGLSFAIDVIDDIDENKIKDFVNDVIDDIIEQG